MGFFETIPYKALKKEGKFEIREYPEFLLASTRTKLNTRMDSGFNNVFDYISGQNNKNQKISMTTPVVSYTEDKQLVTGFYVPSQYDKKNVPLPTSQEVSIDVQTKNLYGVIRFSGPWIESNFLRAENALKNYLKINKYVIESERLIFRYQPPFVPSFLRHNEIAFKVSSKGK